MAKVDLHKMMAVEIPAQDWTITDVLDDIIMATFVDTDKQGEFIERNGVLIKIDPARQLWRVARVIIAGPKCSDRIKKGAYIMFPNDKGIHVPRVGGFDNVVFLNEERIFGLCKPNK